MGQDQSPSSRCGNGTEQVLRLPSRVGSKRRSEGAQASHVGGEVWDLRAGGHRAEQVTEPGVLSWNSGS